MSGKQAKAKRKSAKKTAADSASAPMMARAQKDFIIDNVRCFAGEQRVPILSRSGVDAHRHTQRNTLQSPKRRLG